MFIVFSAAFCSMCILSYGLFFISLFYFISFECSSAAWLVARLQEFVVILRQCDLTTVPATVFIPYFAERAHS